MTGYRNVQDSDHRLILATLRNMAWMRAKGELLSILETHWEYNESEEVINHIIENFIRDFEEGGHL